MLKINFVLLLRLDTLLDRFLIKLSLHLGNRIPLFVRDTLDYIIQLICLIKNNRHLWVDHDEVTMEQLEVMRALKLVDCEYRLEPLVQSHLVEVDVGQFVSLLELFEDLNKLEELLLASLAADCLENGKGFGDKLADFLLALVQLICCTLQLIDPLVLKVIDLFDRCESAQDLVR